MKSVKKIEQIVIGEGELAVEVHIISDGAGAPHTVHFEIGGQKTQVSAEALERIASVVSERRCEAIGYSSSVCVDHGYFSTKDGHKCPKCVVPAAKSKPVLVPA